MFRWSNQIINRMVRSIVDKKDNFSISFYNVLRNIILNDSKLLNNIFKA